MSYDDYKRKYGDDVPLVGEAARKMKIEALDKQFGKQRGIRLNFDLEKELLVEYEKEKRRLRKDFGIKYSLNEFFNHMLARGLQAKREEGNWKK